MTTLDDIYSPRILEIAANITHTTRLEDPDATSCAHSKLCGSKVVVDLNMSKGRVTDFGMDVKACLLGQTSAAVMAKNIISMSAKDLHAVGDQMRAMLKDNAPPPKGVWQDLEILQPVRDFKARHTSTLLVFDAVEDAIRQIEGPFQKSQQVDTPSPKHSKG